MKTLILMLWAFVTIGAVFGIMVFIYTLFLGQPITRVADLLAALCLVALPYGLAKGFEGMLADDLKK